jgi:hypothetical protein
MNSKSKGSREKSVSRACHAGRCKLCHHPKREEIEREWTDWGNTAQMADQYGLTRDSIYRHAHALGLFAKRQRNIRKALEHIIEKSADVEVTAAAVVAAVQAYSKINAQGQWVDRTEQVSLNEVFERMSQEELEIYAKEGTLPEWFAGVATPLQSLR